MKIFLCRLGPKIRLSSRTSIPHSVQIAGAIIKTAFELSEDQGNKLLKDEKFAVSEIMPSVSLSDKIDPVISIPDFMTKLDGHIKLEHKDRKSFDNVNITMSNLITLQMSEILSQNKFIRDELVYDINRISVKINRTTQTVEEGGMFYYVVKQIYNPVILFSCDQQNTELVKKVVRTTFETGIGADKSVGLGSVYQKVEFSELQIRSSKHGITTSCYIPSKNVKVRGRIIKYQPFINQHEACEFLCYSPYSLVEWENGSVNELLDGKIINYKNNKIFNFRTLILPINIG